MNISKKYIFSFFLFFVFLSIVLFKNTCQEFYKNGAYYQRTLKQIEDQALAKASDTGFKVGWSKKNITPTKEVHLAGYGWQREKVNTVRDSVYVRAFVISQNNKVYAILSYDLMIVSPLIRSLLESKKQELGLDGFYFSATHTHHSFGGWDNSLLGSITMGWHDQEIVDGLVKASVACIQEAEQRLSTAQLSYKEIETNGLVLNKFSKQAYVDRKIRCIEFKNKTQKAIMCSFAAHPNVTPSKTLSISNDYPGFFMEALEASTVYDFALFCAGAVGLHVGDYSEIKKNYEGVKIYGEKLAEQVLVDTIHSWKKEINVFYRQHKVFLPEPVFKITNLIHLRPWLFNKILKRENFSYIVQLNLGDVHLIGIPADFSGELYSDILYPNTMITSFNGDYIGYVIPDVYYHKNKNESKALNWYGANTGSYFTSLINNINRKSNNE